MLEYFKILKYYCREKPGLFYIFCCVLILGAIIVILMRQSIPGKTASAIALSNTFLGILLTVSVLDFLSFYNRYRQTEPLAESAMNDLNMLLVDLIFACFFIFPETDFPVNFYSFVSSYSSSENIGSSFDYTRSERRAKYAKAAEFALERLKSLQLPTDLSDEFIRDQIRHVSEELRRYRPVLERIESYLDTYSQVLSPKANRDMLELKKAVQGLLWSTQKGEQRVSQLKNDASKKYRSQEANRLIEKIKNDTFKSHAYSFPKSTLDDLQHFQDSLINLLELLRENALVEVYG